MELRTGFALLVVAVMSLPAAAMSVALSPSVPSPAFVGDVVTWTATVSDAAGGTLWYRFREQRVGSNARILRDYGPLNTLNWAVGDHEGSYVVEVSVRNLATSDSASARAAYKIAARAGRDAPVITATRNPLVFLYSAPACAAGARMRVDFRGPDGLVQSTNYQDCGHGLTMNFYLAGLRAGTTYAVKHILDTGWEFVQGPEMALTTPQVSLPLAPYTLLQPPQPPAQGVLLQSSLSQSIVATDLQGNLVWFYPDGVSFLTAPEPGGLFLGIIWDASVDSSRQILREFDLVGNTVRETNAARVAEQLVNMGMHPVSSFHHDARRLPDGTILVLAATERILTDVQGPGPVNVLGDMIVVLDGNLQVVWAWDAFDHLDATRKAVLGESCVRGGGGCAPFYATDQANDWLHGNSVQLTPDGDILYSARHQDWVIKIDYRNGEGSGDVIWRLGKDGDFQAVSNDPNPWFSHQHDAGFLPDDNSTLTVFDNGNTRRATDSSAHSRGQVIHLDEANRVATFVLNADLGAYSLALGTAQTLENGNYSFDLGWIPGDQGQPATTRMVEVNSSGGIVYNLQAATQVYRAFRMRDLYTP